MHHDRGGEADVTHTVIGPGEGSHYDWTQDHIVVETVVATAGTTVNVPTGVWHEASSQDGAKLITVFTPGGFDQYMAALAAMTEQQLADVALMTSLGETYDTWSR